jgi:hypothetical protein
MYTGLHVKYPLLLSDFNETWNFLDRFWNNPQISNFIKPRPVGAELFHPDGQTDMAKLTVAFRNFSKAHKNTKKPVKHRLSTFKPPHRITGVYTYIHIPLSVQHNTYYYYYYYLSCRSLWSIGHPFGGFFGRVHRCCETSPLTAQVLLNDCQSHLAVSQETWVRNGRWTKHLISCP